MATPPDPRRGALVLDPLAFVHVMVTQIAEARKHLQRYYGAYSDRTRGRRRDAQRVAPEVEAHVKSGVPAPAPPGLATPPARATAEPGSPEARRRSAWARGLKKVVGVDPLLCPRCKTQMLVVAQITDPAVIDRSLAYRRQAGLRSPFDARGPPTPA